MMFLFNINKSLAQQFNLTKDLSPGINRSHISAFAKFNNLYIFNVQYSNGNSKLVRSDGTNAGTIEIDDRRGISHCATANYLFYYSSYSGLKRTDGNLGGQLSLLNINDNNFVSNLVSNNNICYLITKNFDQVWGNTTYNLIRSDGSINGTFSIKQWTNEFIQDSLFVLNDNIYVIGDQCIWKINPINYSTTKIISSVIPGIHVLKNNIAYFSKGDGIYTFDGNNAPVKTVNAGISSKLYNLGDQLIFYGSTTGPINYGFELYRSDGTQSNTSLIKDIYFGYNSSRIEFYKECNGNLFFRATDGVYGYSLWKTDGTANGTFLLKDLTLGNNNDFYLGQYDVSNSKFYFTYMFYYNQNELWSSDGTVSNTQKVLTNGCDSMFHSLAVVGNTIFIDNCDNQHGIELWSTNTTSASDDLPNKDIIQWNLNPISGNLTLKAESSVIGKTIEILDCLGATILTCKVENEYTEIPFNNTPKGMYLIRLNENFICTRFIK
jgi:ELWxxDGT repeat protein